MKKQEEKLANNSIEMIRNIIAKITDSSSFSDYYRIFNEISQIEIKKEDIPENKRIKVGLLSSFTFDSAKYYLDIKCRLLGLFPDIYAASYNQYNQEILNLNSELYSFDPDIVFIAIDEESFVPEYYFLPLESDKNKLDLLISNIINKLNNLIQTLIRNSNAICVINNFLVPYFSPLGILDNKEHLGSIEFFRTINHKLVEDFKDNRRVFVFDCDLLVAIYGKERSVDDKMWFLAKKKFSEEFMLRLCEGYIRYIKALKGLNKKCIVLDLDNILWGGIVGENGFEGIKLGPASPGNVYVEFQKLLLSLFKKGVILAINSKNNIEDALKVIREHPYMILRKNNFAAIKINWRDKIINMKEIAKELNIGLDSLVFIDDSKVERYMMRRALPEVLTIEMPEDVAEYPKTLKELNIFDTLTISAEDKRRGQMYVQRRQRKVLHEAAGSLDEFLYGLNMKIEIRLANEFSIPRIAQLTQRTNQFNLTIKRLSESEVATMANSKDYIIYFLRLEDKSGDEGIVSALFIKVDKDIWIIDNFLMSCRVLGRGAEKCFISFVIKEGKKRGIKQLEGRYIPTKKNILVKDFYRDMGFDLIEKDKDISIWRYEIKQTIEYPKWINVV